MYSTLLNIVASIFVVSCVISMLFVLTRTYFCYFAKPKKCSGNCSCEDAKDARLVEIYCDKEEVEVPVTTPKRVRKPKQTKESIGDFALEAVSKKRAGRKKKS